MSRFKIALSGILLIFTLSAGLPAVAGERFTDNGDGTVTDHLQGLMWARTDNQGDINWKQAEQWVKYTFPDTIEARYRDWRMPTLAELKSLYDGDRTGNGYETDCGHWVKIISQIRLTCGWVWTSETGDLGPTATVFSFQRGVHYTDRRVHNRGYRVLPVRTLK